MHASCSGCEEIAALGQLRPLQAVRKSTGVECQSHAAFVVPLLHTKVSR